MIAKISQAISTNQSIGIFLQWLIKNSLNQNLIMILLYYYSASYIERPVIPDIGNRLQTNSGKTEWLWDSRDLSLALPGDMLPQSVLVSSLGVFLDLGLLLEKQMLALMEGQFAQIQIVYE